MADWACGEIRLCGFWWILRGRCRAGVASGMFGQAMRQGGVPTRVSEKSGIIAKNSSRLPLCLPHFIIFVSRSAEHLSWPVFDIKNNLDEKVFIKVVAYNCLIINYTSSSSYFWRHCRESLQALVCQIYRFIRCLIGMACLCNRIYLFACAFDRRESGITGCL